MKMVFSSKGNTMTAGWRSEHTLLNDAPNEYQSADQFRQAMTAAYLLHGDAIAEKEKALDGSVIYLHYMHPDRLSNVFIGTDGQIRYIIDGRELTRDTIFHLPGPILNGSSLRGESLVGRAGEALGLSVAQQDYAASYYGNGAAPATVLVHPKTLSAAAGERIKASFNNDFRGAKNRHKFALLEEGLDIKQVGSDADKAQLVEARKEQVIEVCRVFRMPPHLAQSLDRATFSNIEEQAREFIEYTMMPHFVRWEKSAALQLLTAYERGAYYWKFSVDALLRGKTLERYQSYQIALQNGILNPNETRALEDWNPYPGGDVYMRPMNMNTNGGSNGQGSQ
jgi:HK97 family phage portal protein